MIITLPLIASLLFILSQGTEFEYKIDPTRCGVDTACFVRQSCLVDNSGGTPDPGRKNVLADFRATDQLTSTKCEVFVQMKAFSKRKYLVIMEAEPEAGSTDIFDKAPFGLHQDGKPQMVCNNDAKPSGNDAFIIESKGVDNNQFEDSKLRCSFFVTSQKSIDLPFEEEVDDGQGGTNKKYENKFPSLEFSIANSPTVLTYTQDAESLWGKAYVSNKCKLDNVQSKTSDDDHYQLEEADLSKKEIECSGQMKLRAAFENTKTKEGNKIACDDLDVTWKWGDGKPVTPTNKFTVGCIKTRYCTACPDTIEDACTTPDCTKPKLELTPEGCKTFECDQNLYAIKSDKNNLKSEGKAKCERKSDGVAAWFLYDNPAARREVTDLSCRTTISCDLTALNKQCPADRKEDDCQEPTVSADDVTCPDGLKLHNGDTVIQFSCDKTKGAHNAETGPIYCAKEKSNEAAGKEEAPSGASISTILGGLFGGVLLLVVIVGGAYYLFVIRKRKAAGVSKGAPASSTKASQKKSSESHNKSAEVRTKDKKESSSDNNKESEKPAAAATGETPKEQAKTGDTPKDKVETPGATPAATAPTTPATPATPAAPAAAPKSNPDDQTGNAPV